MSVTGLTQIVRASIAKAKDVSLRGEAAVAAGAARAVANAPVRAAEPPRAIIAEAGTARGEQLQATVLQRGGVTATIVAALGGNRYVVNVDGEDTPVVLEGAAITDDRALTPGAEVRLVPGTARSGAGSAEAAQHADDPHWSSLAKLIASATRDEAALLPPSAHEQHTAGRTALEPAKVAASAAPIAADPAEPARTAASLQQVVDRSGLFYESHLAQWVAGERTLEALRREPQAQLARAVYDAGSDAAAPAPGASLAREASGLVREQIQALQAQQIAWHGEVWRHQRGEIEIGRDPSHAGEGGQQTWRARLAVELPALGRVEVRLALLGPDLGLRFDPASDDARARIAAASTALVGRLEAQGMRAHVTAATGDKGADAGEPAA